MHVVDESWKMLQERAESSAGERRCVEEPLDRSEPVKVLLVDEDDREASTLSVTAPWMFDQQLW
jgi:hypothetical protein